MKFAPGQIVTHRTRPSLGPCLVVSVAQPPKRVLNRDRVTDTAVPGEGGFFFLKSVTVNVAIPALKGNEWFAKKWDGKGVGASPFDLTPFINSPIVPMALDEFTIE